MSQFVNSSGYVHTDPRVYHNQVSESDIAVELSHERFDGGRHADGNVTLTPATFTGNIDNHGALGAIHVTLPSPSSVQGTECQFTCLVDQTLTLVAPVSDTIAVNGRFYTRVNVPRNGGSINVYSDGIHWHVDVQPSVVVGQ